MWEFLCTPVQSNKIKEIHTFFGKPPAVVQDTGTLAGASAPEYSFEVVNTPWVTHFSVDLHTRDDDQTGDIAMLGQSLMEQFLYHQDAHVMGTLSVAAASTPAGYDGVSLINDAHPVGATTADNNLANAFSEASFNTAWKQMEGFVDAQNQQPALAVPDLLVVSPTLRAAALNIATSVNAASNATYWTNSGAAPVVNWVTLMQISVLVVPMEFATTEYYLVDSSKSFKPMLFQDRMRPKLSVTAPGSDTEVLQNKVIYVARARYRAWAGYWQYIVRGNA